MHLTRPSSYVKTDDYIQILYYDWPSGKVRSTLCCLLHFALKEIGVFSLLADTWPLALLPFLSKVPSHYFIFSGLII